MPHTNPAPLSPSLQQALNNMQSPIAVLLRQLDGAIAKAGQA